MKAYIFTPGDSICRKGEVAREMFIIADGILEVLSETGRVLTTMKAGDFFGEIGILNLDGLNKYGLGSLSIKQQQQTLKSIIVSFKFVFTDVQQMFDPLVIQSFFHYPVKMY